MAAKNSKWPPKWPKIGRNWHFCYEEMPQSKKYSLPSRFKGGFDKFLSGVKLSLKTTKEKSQICLPKIQNGHHNAENLQTWHFWLLKKSKKYGNLSRL